MIDVNFSPILHPYTGNQPVVTVEGGTVGECIKQAVERFPKLKRVLYNHEGSMNRNINIYINEADTYPDPLSKPLQDGDRLRIVMVIGGG